MPTQIERMVLLLAARDQRVVRCHRDRRHDLYGLGQVLGRLMRHLRGLASIEVCLLPRGVVDPACFGLLVAATRGANRLASRELGAAVAAVRVAVVAPPAEEEHLSTTAAADEAQGVHGSGRDRQELDAVHEPCDEGLVDPGSGRTT